MATPKLCSDRFSIEATAFKRLSVATESVAFISPAYSSATNFICPFVKVPVLSNTKCSMECKVSSTVPFLTKMPLRAETPEATAIAIGVARPNAQGQVIISTAVAVMTANSTLALKNQYTKLANAKVIVTETNHGIILSAVH